MRLLITAEGAGEVRVVEQMAVVQKRVYIIARSFVAMGCGPILISFIKHIVLIRSEIAHVQEVVDCEPLLIVILFVIIVFLLLRDVLECTGWGHEGLRRADSLGAVHEITKRI